MQAIYILTKWLTLPGAMFRAVIEHMVCRACHIPVEDNRIIRNDELFGHVEHEFAPTARKSFALCFVPAFICGLLAFLLILPSSIAVFYLQMSGWYMIVVNIIAYWFAFSLFCNSYPLVEDAMNMKEKVYGGKNVWLKIVYAIGFVCLYILSYAEKYCVTFLFALAGLVWLVLAM